ncbi:MAG: restriction endonuclease subunit S [Sulfurimicrobium sp.]|jgi:type I restriction enzyme S subunit|nr:restriction endonuclease subunit S [Sulfurimicrobium sp.]
MSNRLRDLAEVHYGKSPNDVLSEDSTVPVIGTGGIYGRASRSLFSGPAVVVARKGTLGTPQFVDEPFWPVDTTYAVLAKPGVDTKWLYYSLAAFDLSKLNEATGVPSISRDWLYKIMLGSADFDTQCRIAEILSTLDEAIEQTEALIAKHQQIKAGLMHDLFTRGITPDGHLRPAREQAHDLYKESLLGWIPKEWEVRQVKDVISGIEQGWSPDCEHEPAGNQEWGVLKTSSVVWGGFDRTENKRLPTYLLPRPDLRINKGDVLMTRAGPNSRVGVVALVDIEPGRLMLSDKIYRLVPVAGLSSEFLTVALSSAATQHDLDSFKTGLAESQTNISQAIVRRLSLPIPKKDEREAICKRISVVTDQIRATGLHYSKLQTLKHGLMHDLLAGHVRVKFTEKRDAHG